MGRGRRMRGAEVAGKAKEKDEEKKRGKQGESYKTLT